MNWDARLLKVEIIMIVLAFIFLGLGGACAIGGIVIVMRVHFY